MMSEYPLFAQLVTLKTFINGEKRSFTNQQTRSIKLSIKPYYTRFFHFYCFVACGTRSFRYLLEDTYMKRSGAFRDINSGILA